MKIFKSCGIVFLFIASSILFSCGGGGGSGTGDLGGVGTVSMSLTDAMSNQFNAMYVTINDVQVHTKGSGNGNNGWVTVSTPNLPKTFNLYELTNGVREQIGLANLSAGDYTQMRLMIGTDPDDGINILSEAHPYANYVIDTDDNYQELKIPSGVQSGYKIVHGFTISPNQTTELTLDFLAEKSVVVGGNGNWHIQPTVKVLNTPEQSIIRGWVTSNGTNGISGALVSVQRYNGIADDPKDEVTIQASTITDEDGYFSIFVSPLSNVDDEYNLVVYAEGKTPEYRKISGDELESGDTLTFFDNPAAIPNDKGFIQLSDAIINNVYGLVTITDASIEQYASVSFRQDIGVSPDIEMIEITSLNVAHESSYSINLPNGSYSIVASTLYYDTIEDSFTVSATPLTSIKFPINFP
jgi:hypothetical protein